MSIFRPDAFGIKQRAKQMNQPNSGKYIFRQAHLMLWRIKKENSGATAVEYGLLAGLIAVGIAGGIGALADLVNFMFEMIADETATVADTVSSED